MKSLIHERRAAARAAEAPPAGVTCAQPRLAIALAGVVLFAACGPVPPRLGARAVILHPPPPLPDHCPDGTRPPYPATLLRRFNDGGEHVDAAGRPDLAGCRAACAAALRPGEFVVGCHWARTRTTFACEERPPDLEDPGALLRGSCWEDAGHALGIAVYCHATAPETAVRRPVRFGDNDEVLVCELDAAK